MYPLIRARAASFRVGGLERQTSKDESTGDVRGYAPPEMFRLQGLQEALCVFVCSFFMSV